MLPIHLDQAQGPVEGLQRGIGSALLWKLSSYQEFGLESISGTHIFLSGAATSNEKGIGCS